MNVMRAPRDNSAAFQLLEPAWISNTYSSCAATENSGPEIVLCGDDCQPRGWHSASAACSKSIREIPLQLTGGKDQSCRECLQLFGRFREFVLW